MWMLKKPRPELEDIVIAWLFFGTLAEVTCCYLDKKDHLQVTEDGRCQIILNSTSMDRILRRWHYLTTVFRGVRIVRGSTRTDESEGYEVDPQANPLDIARLPSIESGAAMGVVEAELNAQGRSLPFERAFRCLQRSRAIIGFLCQAIDPKIVFAIATLHEFLATALTDFVFQGKVAAAYEKRADFKLGSWVEGADFTHHNRAALRTLGWCPRTEQNMWMLQSRSLAIDHFEVNLKSHQSTENHSQCSADICMAYQLNPEGYFTPHVDTETSSESCEPLGLDPGIASAILASGSESYPLVKISKTDNDEKPSIFIEALDSADGDQYIAISHVWSHGLGNPNQNILPRCQLERIQALVDSLACQIGIQRGTTPFWMDTLCCPLLSKDSRRAAILKMAKTYEQAACVLVIDRDLCSRKAQDLSELEILMYAYRTTWMQRLWTLQEARLAKQVWFQFQDRAVNIERVLDEFLLGSQSITRLLFRRQFLPLLYNKYQGLRDQDQHLEQLSSFTASYYRLINMSYSLSGRSTSWASDEAICITNLLRLDLAPVLEIPTNDPMCASRRMKAMWKQWTTVPTAMIFNRAPRLPYKGFRWAHSTFLRTQKWAIPLVEVSQDAIPDLSGRGLLVRSASFILETNDCLHMINADMRLEREVDETMKRTAGTEGLDNYLTFLICDAMSGSWYDVQVVGPVHEPMPDLDPSDKLAIIWNEDGSMSSSIDRHKCGLLVSVNEADESSGLLYVASLYHVSLGRMEAANEKLLQAALQVRQILQDTPSLCGSMQADGTVTTGESFTFNDAELLQKWTTCNYIARTVLDEPDVKSYIEASMLKNRDPDTLIWRTATREQRQDWLFRNEHGDAGFFFKQIVNVWLNAAFTLALPLPRAHFTYCVD